MSPEKGPVQKESSLPTSNHCVSGLLVTSNVWGIKGHELNHMIAVLQSFPASHSLVVRFFFLSFRMVTWRIIPGLVSGDRITPIYKPWSLPIWKGSLTTRSLGDEDLQIVDHGIRVLGPRSSKLRPTRSVGRAV